MAGSGYINPVSPFLESATASGSPSDTPIHVSVAGGVCGFVLGDAAAANCVNEQKKATAVIKHRLNMTISPTSYSIPYRQTIRALRLALRKCGAALLRCGSTSSP
jgi:hypothetical protein